MRREKVGPASPTMVLEFLTQYHYEPVDVALFLTLVLLEGALSFDNAAILAALVRRLPEEQRRKALLYGLGGAYVFRLLAILFVSVIIANPWLRLVGGAYLVYLMLKHLLDRTPHDDGMPSLKIGFLKLSPFWTVVATVELADIAFALDQIVAAVGLVTGSGSTGDKRLVIILAAFVAILLLRVSAYYVGRIIDWWPRLETLAYVAVGWVGVKLLVEDISEMAHHAIEVPRAIGAGVTLALIVLPVAVRAAWQLAKYGKLVPAKASD